MFGSTSVNTLEGPRILPSTACLRLALFLLAGSCSLPWTGGALPPGAGPFGSTVVTQPVPGAPRGVDVHGWRTGKLCDVSTPPYSLRNGSNATVLLQQAIDSCGDLPGGGTVLLPAGLVLYSGSLWLRSNLTLRVEAGAALVGSRDVAEYPTVYTRSGGTMYHAHASLLNGARCLHMSTMPSATGGDDCLEWNKLENVVIEGTGRIDGNINRTDPLSPRFGHPLEKLPTLLGLLWINGLTLRDVSIRRPAFWTVHICFCNNVRITGINVLSTMGGMDAIDLDSTWNTYVGSSVLSSGDDNIVLKSGQDESGRTINISTAHVLAEHNTILSGHGLTIGSDMSAGVHSAVFRHSVLVGAQYAIRFKSQSGRGGLVTAIRYQNLSGTVDTVLELSMNYHHRKIVETNNSLLPELHNVTMDGLRFNSTKMWLQCDGIPQSHIDGLVLMDSVTVGVGAARQACRLCSFSVISSTKPAPTCGARSSHGPTKSLSPM